jgi:pyrophosphatase PpaX
MYYNPTMSFDWCLFDLDGTLIDSVDLILSSYRHTLSVHRGEVPSDDVWLQGLGTPLSVQFRHFTEDPDEIDAMVATYREHNLLHHDAMVQPFDGVKEALDVLAGRAKGMAVVTSKKQDGTLRGLRHCGLQGYFGSIVASDDVEHPKPHPEPVERAVELLGADLAKTVFVGDSPHDLTAGRAAGVNTAAALWGPFSRELLESCEPDICLTCPAEIANL